MCEIFVLKRKKGFFFSKEDLKLAADSNSNGAGFCVFEFDRKKKEWEIIDMDTFRGDGIIYEISEGTGAEEKPGNTLALYAKGGQEVEVDLSEGEKTDRQIWEYEAKIDRYLELGYSMSEAEAMVYADTGTSSYINKDYDSYESYLKGSKRIGFKDKKEEPNKAVEAIYDKQFQLKPNQMMIAHFRLATSGHSHENTQPILNGNYLTIHNGIFGYTWEPTGYSDTRFFSEKLKNESKKIAKMTPKKERRLIEKLLDEAGGSYSIFIYSFRTGQIYYYKSKWASFNWAYNRVMGSTYEHRFPVRSFEALPKEVVAL